MNIFLCFENFNIEFSSKLRLAYYLIKKKNIKKVYIGHSKIIIKKLLNNVTKDKSTKNILLYKDLWKPVEIIIILLKKLNVSFFSTHEEDHLLLQKNYRESLKKNFISHKIQKKVDGFFTLSDFTRKFYLKENKFDNSKILSSGNLRYDYMKFLKKNFFDKAKQKNHKKILLCLNFEYFSFSRFKNFGSNTKTIDLLKKNVGFGETPHVDKFINYKISKELLLNFKLLVNDNSLKFILRPYPGEEKYLKYYKLFFKNKKNIEYDVNNTIYESFLKCSKVISAPDNVAVEAFVWKLPIFIYYNNRDKVHKHVFKNHVLLKEKKIIKFRHISEIKKKITSNKIIYNSKKIEDNLGLNLKTYEIISNKISNTEIKQKHGLKSNILIFFLSNILKCINLDFKQGNYSSYHYENFKNKFKFSFSRIILAYFTFRSSLRFDAINLIYKFILGRNYSSHPVYTHQPTILSKNKFKINNLFKKFLIKKNQFFLIRYEEGGKILVITKKK